MGEKHEEEFRDAMISPATFMVQLRSMQLGPTCRMKAGVLLVRGAKGFYHNN
jgi:hypothetical protein